MKSIIFVSEKGGVGKTRLSDELYYYYQRQGTPTSFYSLDPQNLRDESRKVNNPKLAIVDTAGTLMDDQTVIAIQAADLVVIPTRPTGGNIQAFSRTLEIVKDNTKAPIVCVINGTNRYNATQSFLMWFEEFKNREDLQYSFTIPQAEIIVQAENLRCSVCDLNNSSTATFAIKYLCVNIDKILLKEVN